MHIRNEQSSVLIKLLLEVLRVFLVGSEKRECLRVLPVNFGVIMNEQG